MSGIRDKQEAALAIGSRVRVQQVAGPTNHVCKVYGPNGRQIASFFIANSDQEQAESIAKKQISFRLFPA